MGNGITPLSQILYDLFFDMSLVQSIAFKKGNYMLLR
jgi:hypothetical protein